MFYEQDRENVLRFGDALKGFLSVTPVIKQPILEAHHNDYNIDINLPIFSVVLSPCCSIDEGTISLSPFIPVRQAFFENPYFVEDLTRINRKMVPEQSLSPQVWKKLLPEERQQRLEKGMAYVFVELFVYEKNDLFPNYTVHRKKGNLETKYYMIDFRNTYKINCESLKENPVEAKCLQLSVQTRSELREKIAYYYGRVPKEDAVLLGE